MTITQLQTEKLPNYFHLSETASVDDKYRRLGEFKTQVDKVMSEITDILVAKNAKYGDSALAPKRIFSKASAEEQILVRIDDKLSRISTMSSKIMEDEDTVNDLIGYLILLKIARNSDVQS